MASREVHAPDGHDGTSRSGDVPLDQRFDRAGLYALRAAVAAHASSLGAAPARVAHMVIVASELASNAIQHGGGRGRLRLWRADSTLRCEVSDTGPGIAEPDRAGLLPPRPLAPGGRGLWIVRRLAAAMTVDSGNGGTTITISLPLAAP
jgi:signal transduction histidine kinase